MSRLSHRGAIAAFSAVACLVVAGMASLADESALAVGLAVAGGLLAAALSVRDGLGTEPSATAHFSIVAVCGLGALASLPDERWFTAAALAGVGVMNFARAVDLWVPEDDEEAD